VYFGEADMRLDEKGRLTVPRRMRDTMRSQAHLVWYLTRGFDGCIFLFPQQEWLKIQEQAGRHSSMSGRALDFRRLFYSGVTEATVDRQGRLPVAGPLREHADLEKDVVLIGVDDHLELWDKRAWESYRERKEAEYKEMASSLFDADGPALVATEKGGRDDAY
jgi:transcriptional regulator MraZ